MRCQACGQANREQARFCDGCGAHLSAGAARGRTQALALRRVALGLDYLDTPAFITDDSNRFVRVNRAFARLIGDPVADGLPQHLRFVPGAIVGPYRERFPRGRLEVGACAPGLIHEVAERRLAPAVLWYLNQMIGADPALARDRPGWDGTVIIRDRDGGTLEVSEHVVPVAEATGLNISIWSTVDGDRSDAVSGLTPRQLEIARLYASGLDSRRVADAAGISWRTARAHLEAIYLRLEVHSRAELAARLVREGLL